MNRDGRKLIWAILLFGGILLGVCGMTGCGKSTAGNAGSSSAAGNFDKRLVGGWTQAANANGALAVIFNDDGTFCEILIVDIKQTYYNYVSKTLGKFKAQGGDKFLLYEMKFADKQSHYRPVSWDKEILEIDKVIQLSEWKPREDKVRTIKLIDDNTLQYDEWTLKRK